MRLAAPTFVPNTAKPAYSDPPRAIHLWSLWSLYTGCFNHFGT